MYHDVQGRHGAGKVVIRSAPSGTGIIAGGAIRAVFEMLGLQDVVAKSIGSSNPYNMVRATFDGLTRQLSPKQIANRRDKKINSFILKKDTKSHDIKKEDLGESSDKKA